MMKNAISYYLAQSVHLHKDKDLFIEPSTGEHLSFHDFAVALGGVHRFLRQQSVNRSDIVTLIAANSIDLAVMIYGVVTYGAIAKPLNPQVTAQEIKTLLEHSGSVIIFADHRIDLSGYTGKYFDIDAYRESIDRDHPFTAGLDRIDDPALLIYTSGTTSEPKGVLLSHRNIVHNVSTAIQLYQLDHHHTKICILPLFHMFGLISDLSTMAFCGGTAVVLDVFDITRLSSIATAIQKYPVNSFSAVPLMFELLMRFHCDLAGAHMKFCISGAAPLRQKTAAEFLQTYGYPILPAYGLTETTCFATISPPGQTRSNSAGLPAAVTV
ncbi:MAG: AMP-binding protein, partial [Candidatus Angelobacter sp.]